MLQKQTYVVRHKTTHRALICSYSRHFCECPCELTLGRETKTEISCEWNTKFSIIPKIPLKRVHLKRIPKFSKTFTGIFTVPFNFGPEISEILVEWKVPQFWLWPGLFCATYRSPYICMAADPRSRTTLQIVPI